MVDNRPAADQLSEHLHQALVGRLREVDTADPVWNEVRVVTARDIGEVFADTYDIDYSHFAELETPARLLVDMLCPNCSQVIPDVAGELHAIQSRESVGGPSKVRLRFKAETKNHVCGQQPFPRPVTPDVEGQAEAFPEEAEEEPTEPDREDATAEAEALARLEATPAPETPLDDEDLLPEAPPARKRRGGKYGVAHV